MTSRFDSNDTRGFLASRSPRLQRVFPSSSGTVLPGGGGNHQPVRNPDKFTEDSNMMHVFTMEEGPDTVIAESEEDAWEVWEEHCGESREDYHGERWIQADDHVRLPIGHECIEDMQQTLRDAESRGADLQAARVTMRVSGLDFLAYGMTEPRCSYAIDATCAWWITASGRGFLCSEDW